MARFGTGIVTAGVALALGAPPVAGQVMTFEGLPDQSSVGDFYNGNGGPDLDIVFLGNTLALIDADAGGNGNFANEPTPNTVMFFLEGTAIMNHVGGGFSGGFSFWYTSSLAASVNVYSGLNATGVLLASIDLSANWMNDNCTGDPSGQFCHWDPIGVAFDGVAQSVDFGGTVNQVGYDNITLRSATPGNPTSTVPEPMTMVLLGSGLLGLGAVRRRREQSPV